MSELTVALMRALGLLEHPGVISIEHERQKHEISEHHRRTTEKENPHE